MYTKRYEKIYRWFSARPLAHTALCGVTRLLPLVMGAAYGVLLGGRLFAVMWALRQCLPAAEPLRELVRAAVVPGGTLAGGTLLRHALNFSRPYEQPGFVPLMEKETVGHSFPSRHALSAAVITMAWWRTLPSMGVLLLVLTAAVCVTRVLTGAHYPRDVAAGAALGLVVGGLGMFL